MRSCVPLELVRRRRSPKLLTHVRCPASRRATNLCKMPGMTGLRAVAAALVAVVASGQAVFRSRVDVVTVDVTVVEAGGAPIEGLAADRFDVVVDGVKRRVLWAEYVSHERAPSPPASGASFSSNQQA